MEKLLKTLKERFDTYHTFYESVKWDEVSKRIIKNQTLLKTLLSLEEMGNEPTFIHLPNGVLAFVTLSKESPFNSRSFCYDHDALNKRKEHKPLNSALNYAAQFGARLVNEEEYNMLQKMRKIDEKTSSWLLTPPSIRSKGGALFAERRYDRLFVGANSAESYYSSRGVRLIVPLGDN